MTDSRYTLKALISRGKSLSELLHWEYSAFDTALSICSGRVVLFGAGKLGKNVLKVLREDSIEPLAFCDTDPEKWGGQVCGLTVYSPTNACEIFGKNSLFIITVFDQLKKTNQGINHSLRRNGCNHVIFYAPLFWKYGNKRFAESVATDWILKPSEIAIQCEEITAAYELMENESKALFVEILKAKTFHENEWNFLYSQETPHFCNVSSWLLDKQTCFVDCGAFDGDTLETFLKHFRKAFDRYLAFEPMEANLNLLRNRIKSLTQNHEEINKVKVFPYALSSKSGKLFFDFFGESSHPVNAGSIEVATVRLDDAITDCRVSWIKMDIEGAEREALAGAEGIIKKYEPILSICIYHRSDDLWKIPLLIKKMCKNYKFYLRVHETGDAVCYAIK